MKIQNIDYYSKCRFYNKVYFKNLHNDNISFSSRKLNKEQLSQICKMVNETYPYESFWKQCNLSFTDIRTDYFKRKGRLITESELWGLKEKTLQNHYEVRKSIRQYTKNPLMYFKILSDSIHKYQAINCGELARLVYMVCRLNNVSNDDVKIVGLKTNDSYNQTHYVDHVITKVSSSKGEIGIDALLDRTDYLEDLSWYYQKKYANQFKLNNVDDIIFFDITELDPHVIKINDNEIKELKKLFPEFII